MLREYKINRKPKIKKNQSKNFIWNRSVTRSYHAIVMWADHDEDLARPRWSHSCRRFQKMRHQIKLLPKKVACGEETLLEFKK
jgi:hypothetical protein